MNAKIQPSILLDMHQHTRSKLSELIEVLQVKSMGDNREKTFQPPIKRNQKDFNFAKIMDLLRQSTYSQKENLSNCILLGTYK